MKKLRLAHILVPIDFSPLSDGAIKTALQLARPFAATIHLVHVREYHHLFEYMAPRESAPVSVATFLDQASRRLAEDLKKLAHKYEISPAHCYIQEGAPIFNEIGKVAHAVKADLIVMPTHGRTGLKHLFLGSTAERMAQHSPCPVFVLRKTIRKIDKLLVPVDFSACALAGLQYAIQVADQFAARIFVLHVAEVNDPYAADVLAIYDYSALEESALRNGELQMQAFVRRAQFGSVKFETAVKVGPPVAEICRFRGKAKHRSDHYRHPRAHRSAACFHGQHSRAGDATRLSFSFDCPVSSGGARQTGERARSPAGLEGKTVAEGGAHEKISQVPRAPIPRTAAHKQIS